MKNLLKESKNFKILFEKSNNLISGRYSSKIKGNGIEFIDLKEYQLGDDIRKIDWNITARENKPFIKEFLEEKDAFHYIFLDTSGSMKNKFLSAKIIASSLLISSYKCKDNFSIGFFNKNKIKIFKQSKNKSSLMRYIYELSKIEANGKGDFQKILNRILLTINKRSIISIITDELTLNSIEKSLLKIIKQKHKLNYFHIYSSNEKNIEIGLNSFEDIETGKNEIYDLGYDEIKKYKYEFDKEIKSIETNLINLGIKPIIIDTDIDLLNQIKKNKGVI